MNVHRVLDELIYQSAFLFVDKGSGKLAGRMQLIIMRLGILR